MTDAWRCPICGGTTGDPRWRVPSVGGECGVDAESFRPSAASFGQTAARVLRCARCGHGSLESPPEPAALAVAYGEAADPVSLGEESGQVETGRRTMRALEAVVPVGRIADLGCWTGSLLVAARERGWDTVGVEPSAWAVQRARERGLDVRLGSLEQPDLAAGSCRAVALCDVLEHLADPGEALEQARGLLEPGGAILVTLPDAGSLLARVMGARWWSVLPMHVQYFTRGSVRQLLEQHGFTILVTATHPKVFTARYYAHRLSGYNDRWGRTAVRAVERIGLAERLVAPNFRDRLLVVAAT